MAVPLLCLTQLLRALVLQQALLDGSGRAELLPQAGTLRSKLGAVGRSLLVHRRRTGFDRSIVA